MGQGYDCLVVGGGPGGLTGALYLARFCRRVRLVDDGCSRATRIPRSHNMPGYPDGVRGADLVAAIRLQAQRYGAELAVDRVEALERVPEGFNVHLATEGKVVRARTVLLATGVSDHAPAIPYLADAVRSGALRYCPVCDGYEVRDQVVGVLTDSAHGAREALYLRNFTARVHLFLVEGATPPDPALRHALDEAGVVFAPDPVRSVRQWEGAVVVRHGDAQTRCDSVYGALGVQIHSELALHAAVDEAGYLLTDRHQQTSLDGLYAVGDVAQGLNQISVAAGGAAIAAAAIHRVLGPAWRAPAASG